MAEDHGRAEGREMRWAAVPLAALLAASLPAHAVARPGLSIEQRVQRAEDELAIRRVLIDYHWFMDMRDFDAYANLFAKNGEWINGTVHHKGPDDIRKMMADMFGKTAPGAVNRHSLEMTTNPQIRIDGDHATARSRHLLIWRGPDGRPQPVLAGRYEDELIREDGKWKILRRIDYPVMPTPEEWGEMMRKRSAAK